MRANKKAKEDAIGYVGLALEYFDAVDAMNVGERFTGPRHLRPMLQLLGIGLELSLKADLRAQGVSEKDLKDLGHSITKAYGRVAQNMKKSAETKAKCDFIHKVRGFRDAYVKNIGPDAAGASRIPTNEEIGASVPRSQDMIDRFGKIFASDRGLRYPDTGWDHSARLSIPPYADIPAFYLSIWGSAFAVTVDQDVRQWMQSGKE